MSYRQRIDKTIARAERAVDPKMANLKSQLVTLNKKLDGLIDKQSAAEKKLDQLESQGKDDEAEELSDYIVQLEVQQEEVEFDIANAEREMGKFDGTQYGRAVNRGEKEEDANGRRLQVGMRVIVHPQFGLPGFWVVDQLVNGFIVIKNPKTRESVSVHSSDVKIRD